MGRYIRFQLSGLMMVHFGFQAIMAFMASNIISGIFLAIMTLCWAAAWAKRPITIAFLQFIGN